MDDLRYFDFFKFPSTPHFLWLGIDPPRGDKVLAREDVEGFLSKPVIVEEKIDGANLGISLSKEGELRFQNRGQYLEEPFSGQFSRISGWLNSRGHDFLNLLSNDLIIFGEWCAAKHSISYTELPDWFLVFDVYDQKFGKFWSVKERNYLAEFFGFSTVPMLINEEVVNLKRLKSILETTLSKFGKGPLEGIVLRREVDDFLEKRAKIVRSGFVREIGEHWKRKKIEWQRLNRNPHFSPHTK